MACCGDSPQFVGQVESTSTMESPFLSICVWNAFLIAFFAATTFLTESTETRSA